MKLENQCCSLIQAKKLKELGISQNGYFSWFGDETRRLMDNGVYKAAEYGPWLFVAPTQPINAEDADHRNNVGITEPLAASFTVAELGEMLPDLIEDERQHELVTVKEDECWLCMYCTANDLLEYGYKTAAMTDAQARASMLIDLLEKGIIAASEVNERLK